MHCSSISNLHYICQLINHTYQCHLQILKLKKKKKIEDQMVHENPKFEDSEQQTINFFNTFTSSIPQLFDANARGLQFTSIRSSHWCSISFNSFFADQEIAQTNLNLLYFSNSQCVNHYPFYIYLGNQT